MNFLLEIENNEIKDIEVFNAKKLIEDSIKFNQYDLISLQKLKNTKEDFSDYIPIGNLPFIKEWLKKYKNIENMTPIEVPTILRDEKYLNRSYDIISFENLKLEGYKFIKDVDKLKQFSFIGDLSNFNKNDKKIFCSQNYLISNIIDIVSEYRVFVSDLKIEAIQHYDGDCTIFPDMIILREMIGKYYLEKNRPKSYTIDIAILKNGKTVIIEIHPVVSVGTYGFSSPILLQMYKDGIEYYMKTEKK